MEKRFFTSDTHFGHTKILEFQPRPFSSVEEMDSVIIERWNSVVGKNDLVYFLGDMCWKKTNLYVPCLNGQIHWMLGNHDRESRTRYLKYKNVKSVQDIKTIKIGDISICMAHYAMRVWNKSHHNSWHLYGHSHGKLPGLGKSFDVCSDCHNYTPLSFDQVAEIMKDRPDNDGYRNSREDSILD